METKRKHDERQESDEIALTKRQKSSTPYDLNSPTLFADLTALSDLHQERAVLDLLTRIQEWNADDEDADVPEAHGIVCRGIEWCKATNNLPVQMHLYGIEVEKYLKPLVTLKWEELGNRPKLLYAIKAAMLLRPEVLKHVVVSDLPSDVLPNVKFLPPFMPMIKRSYVGGPRLARLLFEKIHQLDSSVAHLYPLVAMGDDIRGGPFAYEVCEKFDHQWDYRDYDFWYRWRDYSYTMSFTIGFDVRYTEEETLLVHPLTLLQLLEKTWFFEEAKEDQAERALWQAMVDGKTTLPVFEQATIIQPHASKSALEYDDDYNLPLQLPYFGECDVAQVCLCYAEACCSKFYSDRVGLTNRYRTMFLLPRTVAFFKQFLV